MAQSRRRPSGDWSESMSKRAQVQPIDREAISFEDAFMCGWIWGYGSLASDTLEDMDQQQKRALGVFTRTYRVAPVSPVEPTPPQEPTYLTYAARHLRHAIDKAEDAPASSAQHEKQALFALTHERIPTHEEALNVWVEPTPEPER